MPRGLTLIIGGAILMLGLVAGGMAMYRPSRPSYINATPEPIGRPAAAASAQQGVDTERVPASAAPTEVAQSSTVTIADRAIVVAASVFPEPRQMAQGTPIILSFSAQGGEMQQLCSASDGLLDSGLCSIRGLKVASVSDAGVSVPLTDGQVQTLARVRDAGVAITAATDNAVLMATTSAQQPAAAATSAPAPTVAAAASGAPAAAAGQQAQSRARTTFVDGLPLMWVAIGVLALVVVAGGGAFLLRRRRGGASPMKTPKPTAGRKFSLPKRGGDKTPAASIAPAPAGLSLNLGSIEVQPLLDDDAAIAESAPRAAAESFTSAPAAGSLANASGAGTFLDADDDLFAPGAAARPAAAADARASSSGGSGAGAFLSADDDLFASDFAPSPATPAASAAPDVFGGSGAGAFLSADDDLFASTLAVPLATSAAPSPALAAQPAPVDNVFSTPPSAPAGPGVLDDLQPEPVVAAAEPIIPRLGAPLPPARPAEALPPTAALDRQAALRWVKRGGES